MDDRTPSDPNTPGRPHQEVPVPEPHRGEPVPPANKGTRPEADPSVVRPDEEESIGPVEGLVTAAGAKATEEATPGGDPEAEALLAQMGVEEEGIEAGQILGLVGAIIASIIALVIVLIFLFYEPFLGETEVAAEDVDQYPELMIVRTEAAAKLNQYTRTDSTYTVPIERAMGLVVAGYATAGSDYAESGAAIPTSRARWNTLMVRPWAVPAAEGFGAPRSVTSDPATPYETLVAPTLPPTGEEVGVDELEEAIPDDN